MYLPNRATIDEACEWLQHQTGQKWTLPRLLEEGHLVPYVWIDYVEGLSQIFGDRREGYLTKMVYHGDVVRLAADRSEALLTMFTAHDGNLIRPTPGWRVDLKDIRFLKNDLQRVAEIINKAAQPQAAAPAPVVAESANDAPVDGITTAQVAAIFDGMPYTAENWPRRLSDTKWLEPAQVALGAQGGASSLWNPATLARLIHGKERGTAKQKTLEALNRKFKSKPVLAPWRTAWDEHYDMFKDADGSH